METAIRWLEDTSKILFLLMAPVYIWNIDYQSVPAHFTCCLFKNLTGHDCYGCGFLRGCSAFLHLDFHAMIRLNRLNAITVPLLCFLYCKEFYKKFRPQTAVSQNDRVI